MTFILSFCAGLLATLSPCVFPILPSLATSAFTVHRFAPLFLAAGILTSFTSIGFLIALTGSVFGISLEGLRTVAAILLILMGAAMFAPFIKEHVSEYLSQTVGQISANGVAKISSTGLLSQFNVGLLIGLVWTPCIGPSLGAAVTLAAQGSPIASISSLFLFGSGVMSPFLATAYGLKGFFAKKRTKIVRFSSLIQRLYGGLLMLYGAAVLSGADKTLEAFVLDLIPEQLTDLIFSI